MRAVTTSISEKFAQREKNRLIISAKSPNCEGAIFVLLFHPGKLSLLTKLNEGGLAWKVPKKDAKIAGISKSRAKRPLLQNAPKTSLVAFWLDLQSSYTFSLKI
jgi:hypothetical protein